VLTIYTVRHNYTGPPSTKWKNFVTVLFLGIKILTTKHEILLHAMSLKGESRTSTDSTAWDELDQRVIDTAVRQWRTRVRACVKAKADTLNTS